MSWAGTGDAYVASYAALCAGTGIRLRALAGPPAGRSLLDVGAGDGRLAQEWSDAGWRVVACEPEPSMRAAARRRQPHLTLRVDALPHLDLPDGSVDVVVANFVLNHLPDPRAGAAELRRVSRDAALATTWTASPSALWQEVSERAGITRAAPRRPAEQDFERTASGFERMLRESGWHPEVTELTWTWTPTADTLWRSVTGGVAGAGALYAALSDAERDRFRSAFDSVVADRSVGGRIPHTQTAAIAVDRR